MNNLLRFDPFFRAFEPLLSTGPQRRPTSSAFAPRLEIRETDASFVLVADLPGVAQDAVDISVDGRELTIAGARDKAALGEGDKLHLHERAFGSFERKFTLPDEVDAETIEAALKDGVLTVTIPKQPQSQPRKIRIRTGKGLADTA